MQIRFREGGPFSFLDYSTNEILPYTYIYTYTRIKRALRARRGLRNDIMGSYYGTTLPNCITGNIEDNITELCYRVILRDHATESYYGIILRDNITELYNGII